MAKSNQRSRNRSRSKNNDKKRFLPYQEHFHLHYSAVIFIIVLIYILIVVFNYLTDEKTGIYEVVRGDNNVSSNYTAFIFREENTYTSPYSGYVNYYLEAGNRIRKNSIICTMDEKGDFLKQIITQSSTGSSLSDDKLARFKNSFDDLITSFDLNDYDKLYTAKNSINLELLTILAAEGMEEYFASSDEYSFDIINTPISGIYANTCDGYENFEIGDVNASILDDSKYLERVVENYSGKQINEGDFLYKIIPDDDFSIVFKMSDEDLVKYWESTYVTVFFDDIGKELSGKKTFVFDSDGNRYVRLDFSEYGFNLSNSRYTSITLKDNAIEGLEIPQTALIDKPYYVIPIDVTTSGGNSTNASTGVLLQTYEEGQLKTTFKAITIVDQYEDQYYLVDMNDFAEGDSIINPNTNEVYLIGVTKTITGVYSVNKGYAIFKPVNILYKLDEGYCIVEEGVRGSIALYDRIALNAELISEGEIIY
ncbi:MAG: hypothetical protein K6F92_07960 [Lachnospiraceae bacterium]|nr:hypothetical protein [Lachnospiraceae bacterium]